MSRIEVIGLVVDPVAGTNVSESDRCDRTRRGSGNLTGTGQEDPGRNGTLTGTGLPSQGPDSVADETPPTHEEPRL